MDVLQPDLSRCGGLAVARRVAHLADDLNVLIVPHSWGSRPADCGLPHFSAFLKSETLLEFNTSADVLSRGLAKKPLQVPDGVVDVPDTPGLGVEPDLDTIERLQTA